MLILRLLAPMHNNPFQQMTGPPPPLNVGPPPAQRPQLTGNDLYKCTLCVY